MDYEKAYKELIEKLRKAKDDNDVCDDRYCVVIDSLVPELAESEDEGIRKELIRLLSKMTDGIIEYYTPIPLMDFIAYLEKQKEQKPAKLDDDTEVGLDRALQIVKDAKGNLGGYQSDDGIYECDHAIQTLERILKNGIEQKPARTAKEMWKEMRLEVYAQASGNRHEPNYSDDSTKMFSLCDIDEIFEKIGNSNVGSQPAEWSLTDATFIEEIDETLFMAETGRNEVVKNQIEKERNWLKSLPERFNLQPRQEWSEEDINMLDLLRAYLNGDAQLSISMKQTLIIFLNSLIPQPHWKLSEEQMKTLIRAQSQCCPAFAEILQSIHDDLTKL